jgi:hypothetical protein
MATRAAADGALEAATSISLSTVNSVKEILMTTVTDVKAFARSVLPSSSQESGVWSDHSFTQ